MTVLESWNLRLPPLPERTLGTAKLRAKARELIGLLAGQVSDGIRTFGLEQKAVAFCALNDIEHDDLDREVGSGGHVGADPRRLVGRLSFEPIVYSYWRLFADDALTSANVQALAEALGGPKAITRTTGVRAGSPETGYQVYPPPPRSGWAEEVLKLTRSVEDPLTSSIVALGTVAIMHPLQDGNGRLGRALLWSRLALLDGVVGPMFPLGFTMVRNPAWIAASSIDLGVKGDWSAFADRYLKLMISSMELALTLHSSKLL